MLMVGDRNDHRVHILAVQDLFITARCRDLLLHGFLRRLVPAVVKVAHRDAFHARHRQGRIEKLASARARANGCESDAIARCYRAARAPERHRFQQADLRTRSGGRSARTDPHERPAC